jgi:hypothetical protein
MLTRDYLNMRFIFIVMRNIHNDIKSNPEQFRKAYKISSGSSDSGRHNNNSNKKYLKMLF